MVLIIHTAKGMNVSEIVLDVVYGPYIALNTAKGMN